MKKIFVILLSVLLVLSFSFSTMAASVSLAPTGDKVVFTDENWAYEKIQGYGYELDEYIGSATEVVLPWTFAKEYITVVGDYAFNNRSTITSVTTTSVIEKIGNYAFDSCSSLEKIKLFDTLVSLGAGCFYGDGSLVDINLEDTSIAAIPEYCFAECGLSEIILPDTCTSIGNMAFYKCGDLSKITIPRSVTTIDDTAFLNSENLTIYCYTDSAAHQYAVAKDIPFVLIDAPAEVTFILGDADGDGFITVVDATKIQRVLVELDEDPDGMIALRAADGELLNITHATAIQRYLADYSVSMPIGTKVTRTVPV